MSYQQLLAGGLTFQLYNKQTNSIIPSSISDGGGYLEIVEDADDSHDTIYKIDQFAGAKTEITLYTEGQSAATYALMAVSQNEGIHSIRTFSAAFEVAGDTVKNVFVEIDGKMYLPGIKSGQDYIPINDVDGQFEEMAVSSYITGGSVFPFIPVTLEDDPNLGEGAIMVIPSIDNIRTYARDCIEIFYKESYQNDEPWKYGQDGFFYLGDGWAIRVNGIWHAIADDLYTVLMMSGAANLKDSEDIYKTANPSLVMDVESSGINLTSWKTEKEEDFGITFGNDIPVVEKVDGDNVQPFTNHTE